MPEIPENIVPITPDARTAAEKFSAEHDRELLTILFTDMVDSTKLQSDLGNVEAARLTELHRKIVRDELAKYDAREIEWAGDSCLAVFTKPSDAVVFALRMQAEHRRIRETEPKLPTVRVGMHLGEIVVKTGEVKTDLFGLQVSESARVMSVAQGNQIFCTRAVFDNARGALKGSTIEGVGDVTWVSYGRYMLKGSDEPVELCEVGSSEVAILRAPEPSDKVSPLLPDGATTYHPLVPSDGVPHPLRRAPLWTFAVAAVALVALGVIAGRNAPNASPLGEDGPAPAPEPKPLVRLSINLDPSHPAAQGDRGGGIALSPDGSLLVYGAGDRRNSRLVSRKLAQRDAQAIPGADGGRYPVFSPDGAWIAFLDLHDEKFKIISVRGGAPVTLCDFLRGAPFLSWGDDGYIYLSGSQGDGLYRVAEAGGEPENLTSLRDGEIAHGSPHPLPGGRFVLFSSVKNFTGEGVAIAAYSHDSGETTTILEGAWNPKYVPTGHLVYEIPGGLMAAPFDSDRLEFTGPAVPVGEDRMVKFNTIMPAEFAISASGSFAHVVGSGDITPFDGRLCSLVWVDRNGNETPLDTPPRFYESFRLSPDGRYLAVSIRNSNPGNFDPSLGADIWVYDLKRNNTPLRLTFDNGFKGFPVWTPDSTRVVYASSGSATGPPGLKWKSADGTGAEEPLATNSSGPLRPYAWTPDGQGLVIGKRYDGGKFDLFLFSPGLDEEPRKLTDSPFRELRARLSPDGRWIAYVSNRSNRDEVYVQSFPEMEGMWQISTDGGTDPIWSPDGSELFYRNREAVIAVPVETEPVFRPGTPEVLFEGKYRGFGRSLYSYFDLAPDGERFLMLKLLDEDQTDQGYYEIAVVLNWLENLERIAPVPEGK